MRIVHLPSSYLPESLGGTEIYVHHFAQAQVQQGHQAAVVLHEEKPGWSDTDGYEVYRLPPHVPRRRADVFLVKTGAAPPGFEDFLEQWRPDVAHFHAFTLGAGLDHVQTLLKRNIPYFVTYHTPAFSCQRGSLLYLGKEACDGKIQPERCTACTLQARQWPLWLAKMAAKSPVPWNWLPEGPWITRWSLASLFKDRLPGWREFFDRAAGVITCASWSRDLLIANGISETRITTLRQARPGHDRTRTLRLPLDSDRPLRLGFFGRLTSIKGPDIFVRGIQHLIERGIPVRGEVVGPMNSSEANWLQDLLASAKNDVQYLGTRLDADLQAWVRSLDLVVIPSRCLETGPLTLLEAWDQETPVIGADLGGIRESLLSANQPEFLFAPNDPLAMADAVCRTLAWHRKSPKVQIRGMVELVDCIDQFMNERLGNPPISSIPLPANKFSA